MLNSRGTFPEMRLGRLLLALLAPLVSFTPALRADLAATGTPAAADSLASLLRASVPLTSALAVETAHSSSASLPHIAVAGLAPFFVLEAQAALCSPAEEAHLRLLSRRYNRSQLRC